MLLRVKLIGFLDSDCLLEVNMRRVSAILLLAFFTIALASCSSAPANVQHPEQIPVFWNWFKANQQQLFNAEGSRDRVLTELGINLKNIEQDLTFEIGRETNGKREIDVSADGIPELFPLVKQVVAAAPKMEKWKVVAFRQRVSPEALKELAIRGEPAVGHGERVDIAVKDMRASLTRAGDKANVDVFLKNYSGKEGQQSMVLIMLQQAIGEYDLVTKVGDIRFASIEEADAKNSVPFAQLGPALDKLFSAAKK
jgi:hypothetical protein